MKAIACAAFLLLALCPPTSSQEVRKDDILQWKDGSIDTGRMIKLEGEIIEFYSNKRKETLKIPLRDLQPSSIYKIKLDRIDKKSGQAHFDLGEFCMANQLYGYAFREYEDAISADPTLAEKAQKRRDEAHNEDARARFELVKKLHLKGEYEEAKSIVRILLDRYADTPYADEAKKEDAKMAEEISKANEEKKKQLAQQLQAQEDKKAKLADDQVKQFMAKTVELIEEAQRSWGEGLEHESKNLTKADRAWKAAEMALLAAKRNVDALLKSNDVKVLQQAKEMEKQLETLLVKTYYRLGRMWAAELSYAMALDWLNKGMRVPHDEQMDHLLNEVTLSISQLEMRKRAAAKGF